MSHLRPLPKGLLVLLVALLGAGCFWLEPIAEFQEPGGPDGGDTTPLPDGGTQPPDACGSGVPDGAPLAEFVSEQDQLWMYLDPGDVVIPGAENGALRLRLAAPATEPVPVQLVTRDAGVVQIVGSSLICFDTGASEALVTLQAHSAGQTSLLLVMGTGEVDTIEVEVVTELPTLKVEPTHGFYNPGDELELLLQFTHPFPGPAEIGIQRTDSETGDLVGTIEVADGALEVTHVYTFADVPASALVIGPELALPVTTDFRRAPQGPLISEFYLSENDGFVELYNPTSRAQPLTELSLLMQGNGNNLHRVANLEGVEPMAPFSYFLVTWGDTWRHLSDMERRPDKPHNSRRLYLGVRDTSSSTRHAKVLDAVHYGGDIRWQNRESFERRAWEGASAQQMSGDGTYACSGNALDSYVGEQLDGQPHGDSLDDFVRRQADPQNRSFREAFFLPPASCPP